MSGAKHIAAQALPAVGTLLGSMIPGVGPLVGPMIGSALGAAGGAALDGGSLGQVAQAGAVGGLGKGMAAAQPNGALGPQPVNTPLAAATSAPHHSILSGLGHQLPAILAQGGLGYLLGGPGGALTGALGQLLPHNEGPLSGDYGPEGGAVGADSQAHGHHSILDGLGFNQGSLGMLGGGLLGRLAGGQQGGLTGMGLGMLFDPRLHQHQQGFGEHLQPVPEPQSAPGMQYEFPGVVPWQTMAQQRRMPSFAQH